MDTAKTENFKSNTMACPHKLWVICRYLPESKKSGDLSITIFSYCPLRMVKLNWTSSQESQGYVQMYQHALRRTSLGSEK